MTVVIFCLISGVINAITSLVLGILLFVKSYRINTNRYFAYFCFSVACWSVFYSCWLASQNPVMAEYFLRSCMLGVYFIPTTLFHFATNFTNRHASRWFIRFNYIFSFVSMFFTYTPLLAYDIERFLGFWWLKPGVFFHVAFLHFALLWVYALWLFYQGYKAEPKPELRKFKFLVFIAFATTLFGGSQNYLMWYGIPVPPLTNILVSAYVIIVTYGILKQQHDHYQQQLMLSDRYKTFIEITKSVTTSIRDPLTTLKTYSYHFSKHYDDKVFLEKFNGVLAREVQKIQELTDGLSKYSSPEPIRLQRVQVYALLGEVLDTLAHTLNANRVALQRDFQELDSCWLHLDPKQMQQVVTNIVLRSLKTMPEGGQIFISTQKQESSFHIFFKDTGVPIPKEQLDRIFDPLYRYQEDNEGLDLATVFFIIENHGGKIIVESKKDSGNEFMVILPIHEN